MKLLIAGAGWAGLAAAVHAAQAGHSVALWEASRHLGGRARTALDAGGHTLDNGQHILIAAYHDTLALMRQVGLEPDALLQRLPLTLRYPDGGGIRLPAWRPWVAGADVLVGVLRAQGWSWADKLSLLRVAARWRLSGFSCDAQHSVADVCQGLQARVMQELIEPLVVSALNTPVPRASGRVFLRVMRDALFAPTADGRPGSHMLLPQVDLSALMPQAAAKHLARRGASVQLGLRLQQLQSQNNGWLAQSEGNEPQAFDAVLLATAPWEAARLLRQSGLAQRCAAWLAATEALHYEAITTVYARSPLALPQALMALRSSASAPAQFVFDRTQLLGGGADKTQRDTLLAFVVSASEGDAQSLQSSVIAQGQAQLGLPWLEPLQTIVEKRATFACTPALARPATRIAPRLLACGDYIAGPYPATLEGAVRSGIAAFERASAGD